MANNQSSSGFEQLLDQQVQLAMQLDQHLSAPVSTGSGAAALSGAATPMGLGDVRDKICQVYSRIKGIGFLMAILRKLPVVGILLDLLDALCATSGEQ